MIAAAYPSLSYAVLCAVFAAAMTVPFVAILAATHPSPRRSALHVAAAVAVTIAVVVAVTALAHHAAWVDYRRSLG